ncbi:Ribonuclease II [Forsythia ovata]|uniref:Ribonuclease II n=1 Tax=Forsythia ovata TaxID=205694 RepID=A0ABD1WTZ8_9LAMI
MNMLPARMMKETIQANDERNSPAQMTMKMYFNRQITLEMLELKSSEEFFENKSGKRMLQKGLLLEFKKDLERVLLAIAQKPGGKKNWMDLTFLEFARIELLEKKKSVRVEELVEKIFGSTEPLESYCVHLLLSKDDIYFTVLESKCSFSVYRPRPTVQVDEFLRRKHAKDATEKELKEFVKLLKSAREMPSHLKPAKSSWWTEEKIRHRIESLVHEKFVSPNSHLFDILRHKANGLVAMCTLRDE